MNVCVNGRAVDTAGWESAELAAVHELLRQRAIATGLLSPDAGAEADEHAAIERLLEQEVAVPSPTEAECRRYYEAHSTEFRSGELVFARHILFQVTPGVPVHQIRAVAERTLHELLDNPDRFRERAGELSNCPSGLFGGNLGQIGRGDTVSEFEAAVFADDALGVLPGLVKTRHGFHIVAIDHRVAGDLVAFEAVRDRIAARLEESVQQKALRQYVAILAGQAEVVGVDLAPARSPLVQ